MTSLAASAGIVEPQSVRAARVVGAERALIIAAVAIAVISRLAFVAVPFWSDSSIYIYMGKVVATGGTLYRDFYEIKFPGVALVIAPLWKIFGSWWPGYALVQMAMGLGTAWVLSRAMTKHVSAAAGRATLVYGLIFANLSPAVFTGFQLETIQLFFASVAAAFGISAIASGRGRDAFFVGLFAGMAAIVKPTGLSVLAAYFIVVMLSAQRDPRGALRKLSLAACGVAMPIAFVTLWTIQKGLTGEVRDVWHQISFYSHQTPLAIEDLLKLGVAALLLGFPMLIRWRCPRDEARVHARPNRQIAFFAILWLVIESAGVIMQGRMYMYHFLVLAGPAAVVFGMIPRPARVSNVSIALTPAAMLIVAWSLPLLAKLPDGFRRSELTEYLTAHSPAKAYVFADWVPRVLLESDLQCGSRYPHFLFFGNHDAAPLDYSATMLSDFEARQPVYIVLPADVPKHVAGVLEQPIFARRPVRAGNLRIAWARVEAYVAEHYEPETRLNDWEIYRRKGSR